MNDTALLPPHLADQSLVLAEIVLPYRQALESIDHLLARGYFVFAWEGWIKYPDGRYGHSALHQGTHGIEMTEGHPTRETIQEAVLFVRQTMETSQQEWNARPEIAGATLHCCLTIEAV